ncbi:hypothetical protein D3C77_704110 [compost metagenome]
MMGEIVVHAGPVIGHMFRHCEQMLSIAFGQLMTAATRALHDLGHQRLNQFPALLVSHQRRGTGPEQH